MLPQLLSPTPTTRLAASSDRTLLVHTVEGCRYPCVSTISVRSTFPPYLITLFLASPSAASLDHASEHRQPSSIGSHKERSAPRWGVPGTRAPDQRKLTLDKATATIRQTAPAENNLIVSTQTRGLLPPIHPRSDPVPLRRVSTGSGPNIVRNLMRLKTMLMLLISIWTPKKTRLQEVRQCTIRNGCGGWERKHVLGRLPYPR